MDQTPPRPPNLCRISLPAPSVRTKAGIGSPRPFGSPETYRANPSPSLHSPASWVLSPHLPQPGSHPLLQENQAVKPSLFSLQRPLRAPYPLPPLLTSGFKKTAPASATSRAEGRHLLLSCYPTEAHSLGLPQCKGGFVIPASSRDPKTKP